MEGDGFPVEICQQCGLCLNVCICLQMGQLSICSYVAKGEKGGAWICANCWRCEDDCPQGVDLYAVMMRQRRMEPPPQGVLAAIENITTLGCAFRVQGLNEVRKTHGLSPVAMIDRDDLVHLLGKN